MTRDEVKSLINRRRRQMLIHSCLYYRMGTSIWGDKEFDTKGRELVKLQSDYTDIAAECDWAKEFEDWDATTGFHLPLDDAWVQGRAWQVLDEHKKYSRTKENMDG